MQCCELECSFLLLRSIKSTSAKFIATAKLVEVICFADFAIFCIICLISIYFESEFLKKLLFFYSNTEGLESIGFNIPLCAFLCRGSSNSMIRSVQPKK